MTRRKVFDPAGVPASFWMRDDVQVGLARRDVGSLFQIYLQAFPACTQTQLALLTTHDRSDISNWVRGARQGRVSDIEVLARIADGLHMPDEARVLLGLAPADTLVTAIRDARITTTVPDLGQRNPASGFPSDGAETRLIRIAICGSRAVGTDNHVIDAAVRSLARLVLARRFPVSHGPVGIGIEVMTYIADHYQPPDFTRAVGLFGHRNVVCDADYILVIGGAAGTQDEIDLALSMYKRVIAFPASGGTALRHHEQAHRDPRLRDWIPQDVFAALGTCANHEVAADHAGTAERLGEEFTRIVENLLTNEPGVSRD